MIFCHLVKLYSGKYYVFHSSTQINSLNQVPNTVWTSKYKLISIKITLSEDNIDNDVLKVMKEYGIDNVRGGNYNTPYLNDVEKLNIKKKINELFP